MAQETQAQAQGEQPEAQAQSAFNPEKEIKYLYLLRAQLAEVSSRLNEAKEKFKTDNAEMIQLESDVKTQIQAQERLIKSAALDRFINDETDKMPFAGVGIRVHRAYDFDRADALKWAQEHKLALIPESLDEKAFTEICKNDSTRPDFVTVKTVASVTIAADLSKCLPAAETTASGEPF